MARLDDIDTRILAALQDNGRLSNIDVAERVGLSHSSCSRRISRLEREGVILGYRALTDRQKMGLSVRAYCGVLRDADTGWEELAGNLAEIEGVVSVSAVSGDVDLMLEVTPHVTPDNRISMIVRLTKNDVASITSDGVPTLATNEAETELLVNNNDTVVIGGVVKTTQSDDSDGVPFLAGIPGLGYLFGSKSKKDDRNELLIFLTPSIVQLEQKRHIVQ